MYLEGGLENPRKKTLGEKVPENCISGSEGPEKVNKQGRDERTQQDHPTYAVFFLHMSGSLLAFFISALFL